MDVHIHIKEVHIHYPQRDPPDHPPDSPDSEDENCEVSLGTIDGKLDTIDGKVNTIMGQLEDANAALKQIDDATTAQSAVLTELANVQQQISDEIDRFIAGAGNTVPQALVDSLRATGTRASAVKDALDQQAVFARAIASKGANNPVPVPVPTITPA